MHPVCCICTENLQVQEELVVTRCGHCFHKNCLAEWHASANSCPTCRSVVQIGSLIRIYFEEDNSADETETESDAEYVDEMIAHIDSLTQVLDEANEKLKSSSSEIPKTDELIDLRKQLENSQKLLKEKQKILKFLWKEKRSSAKLAAKNRAQTRELSEKVESLEKEVKLSNEKLTNEVSKLRASKNEISKLTSQKNEILGRSGGLEYSLRAQIAEKDNTIKVLQNDLVAERQAAFNLAKQNKTVAPQGQKKNPRRRQRNRNKAANNNSAKPTPGTSGRLCPSGAAYVGNYDYDDFYYDDDDYTPVFEDYRADPHDDAYDGHYGYDYHDHDWSY